MTFGSFPIAERFVSINGEGAHAGKLAAFIRFPGCNLDCSYCDTQWARDPELTVEFVSVEELCDWVESEGVTCVTITGGEPTLQSDLYRLLHALARLETVEVVEIETNGSTTLLRSSRTIPSRRRSARSRLRSSPLRAQKNSVSRWTTSCLLQAWKTRCFARISSCSTNATW